MAIRLLIVGMAADGREAVELARRHRPDVRLMSTSAISRAGMTGQVA